MNRCETDEVLTQEQPRGHSLNTAEQSRILSVSLLVCLYDETNHICQNEGGNQVPEGNNLRSVAVGAHERVPEAVSLATSLFTAPFAFLLCSKYTSQAKNVLGDISRTLGSDKPSTHATQTRSCLLAGRLRDSSIRGTMLHDLLEVLGFSCWTSLRICEGLVLADKLIFISHGRGFSHSQKGTYTRACAIAASCIIVSWSSFYRL